MNVVGISAFFHNSACCLLQNGRLVAAAEEERFSRVKFDKRLPLQSFRHCLERGNIDVGDVDCVAYYESPAKKLSRQLAHPPPLEVDARMGWLDARRPLREIRARLGYDGPVETFDHHLSHAASSFFFSGFSDAAILTVDAVGEWATTSFARGSGPKLEVCHEVRFPHSLGLLYSAVTNYLGFKVLSGEYKVMGLAPYGTGRLAERVRRLVRPTRDGFELALEYFDFAQKGRMYTDALADLFGEPPRRPQDELRQFHKDLARGLQIVLEELLLAQVKILRRFSDSPNLCMAGGVALNCVANSRVLRESDFERLFVQPAAGDAGSALGAAALAHVRLTRGEGAVAPLEHAYLGPSYSAGHVADALEATELRAADYRGRERELIDETVTRLAAGKVVGWFQGAAEFGPRALGARSILADPRDPTMRDRLNASVKMREAFRPFAPVVLEDRAAHYLELDHPSPFMLETCQVRPGLDLPAVTHVDGSCRPQTVDRRTNVRLAALLEAFQERTGCPMLVNTSFNVRGEPMVLTPADALRCFAASGVDALVIEDFLVDREPNRAAFDTANRYLLAYAAMQRAADEALGAIYTFV